ncbi:MAG TPA: malate dehydrogenase, partial [Actinobacteria bacterium]|nr:malate dehydrogenase [Actinomycetota bacterium]
KDVCIGVPVKLGLGGVEEIIELDLTSDEMNILRDSAAEVRESIESLGLE